MSDLHSPLVFIELLQLQAKYIANMAKNSAAQYEVVAVDYEDGVQWRLWHWQQQRSTVLKNMARRW
jgi:DNA/RNA-binding domain of Phe-tRNA-synthetase-like protein